MDSLINKYLNIIAIKNAEAIARQKSLGVWSQPNMEKPWDYRSWGEESMMFSSTAVTRPKRIIVNKFKIVKSCVASLQSAKQQRARILRALAGVSVN